MEDRQLAQLGGRNILIGKLTVNGVSRKFYYRQDSGGDRGAFHQVFTHQDYDLRRFRAATSLTRYAQALDRQGRGRLILDIGANIGTSAIWFHAKHEGARVIAVEPEPNNYRLLERNCEGLGIISIEAAIGPRAGTAYLDDPGLSDWGFRVAENGKIPVRVVSVPELLAERAAQDFTPFICKIDIEGGEADLFSENYAWVDNFALIIIELHDWLYPGKASSRSFLRAISEYDFDFVCHNENVFCFNNRLLRIYL